MRNGPSYAVALKYCSVICNFEAIADLHCSSKHSSGYPYLLGSTLHFRIVSLLSFAFTILFEKEACYRGQGGLAA